MFLRELFQYSVLAALVFMPMPAVAETSVTVKVTPYEGSVDDVFDLQISVIGDQAGQTGEPIFEDSEEFRVEKSGTSLRTSIINFEAKREVVYNYRLYPAPSLEPREYPVPQGKFSIGGNEVKLKRPLVKIIKGRAGAAVAGIDFVQLVSNLEPFVGEQVLYRAEVVAGAPFEEAKLEDREFQGFVRDSFGKARETRRSVGNSNVQVSSLREALYPLSAGEIVIEPRALDLKLRKESPRPPVGGWSIFDDLRPYMFDDFQLVSKRLVAPGLKLTVKPLPPSPVSGLKYVPVGEFKLHSSIDRSIVKEGDAITWIVELEGDGNLRPYDLPLDRSSNDFRYYPEKAELTSDVSGDKIIQKKIYKFAVIPQRAGELVLPSLEIVTFSPAQRDYKIFHSAAETINVTPNPRAAATTPLPAATVVSTDINTPATGLKSSGRGSSFKIPSSLGWLILALPPFIIAAALWRRYRRRKVEEGRATPTVTLTGREQSGELAVILRDFLRSRYGVSGLISSEVEGRMGSVIPDQTLRQELAAILVELERLTYSGVATANEDSAASLGGRVNALLSRLKL